MFQPIQKMIGRVAGSLGWVLVVSLLGACGSQVAEEPEEIILAKISSGNIQVLKPENLQKK